MGKRRTSERASGARAAQVVGVVQRRQFYEALQRLVRIYQFRDRDAACYGDVSPDECYALEAIEAEGALRVGDLAAVAQSAQEQRQPAGSGARSQGLRRAIRGAR